MSDMSYAIRIKNVSKTIKKQKVLDEISLEIKKGEIFGFLWHNGAGKTTTMKAILSVVKIDTGTVEILGGSIGDTEIRRKVGFMPENTYLYKHLSGDEFLSFNAWFYNIHPKTLEKRKQEILEKVWLAHAKNKKLRTYSKGMLQRIGIAQALLHDPELIFLDEPMSGLDPMWRKMVKDLLLELKSEGKTIFFNTHILPDVEAICDSFAIIASGKIRKKWYIKELHEPLEAIFMESMKDMQKNSEYT
jgi:ABC-2 type transport system ATP-binding protein